MTRPEARRVLDFWEAVETVWPLPDPWSQTALVCHQLSRSHALQAAANGQEWKVEPPDAFMPPRYRRPTLKAAPVQPAEDQSKALDQVFKGW